eukprot:Cvel_20037.t2-p1 / transcript=Cvel_20037.t2 / gene=Cvel_20037 / organism=Chromera_velia_CCMP2878 / gene_product=Cathepsin B, putative / transcript_product=Cathepsin B, putative / location=Cvel_scaffold1770:24375-26096(-) / protein_length=386 / sequence_SO=supercontig / SO=protein_coding / is_pseudo=false
MRPRAAALAFLFFAIHLRVSKGFRFSRTALAGSLVPAEKPSKSHLESLKDNVRRHALHLHGGQRGEGAIATGKELEAAYRAHCVTEVNHLSKSAACNPKVPQKIASNSTANNGQQKTQTQQSGERAELRNDELKFDSAVLTQDGNVVIFYFELDASIHPPGIEGTASIAFFFERKPESRTGGTKKGKEQAGPHHASSQGQSTHSDPVIETAHDLGDHFRFVGTVPSVCDLGLEMPGGEEVESPNSSEAQSTAHKVLEAMFREARTAGCPLSSDIPKVSVHKVIEHTKMVVSGAAEHRVEFVVKDLRAPPAKKFSIQKGSVSKNHEGHDMVVFDIPIGTQTDRDGEGEDIPSPCLVSTTHPDSTAQKRCQDFFLCSKFLMSGAPVPK